MLERSSERPELSRIIRDRTLPAGPVIIEADERERAALAERFGILAIGELHAAIDLSLCRKGIRAEGTLKARITQACAVSGEPFSTELVEPVILRFILEGTATLAESEEEDVDFEITAEDCDEIEYSGDSFDLGEAVAQTLGLAIDPYAEGPRADAVREAAGIVKEGEEEGPLASALAALKKG
jgi:hypothetical protein